MKITTKLTLTYLLVSLIVLAVLSTIYFFYTKATLKEVILNHLESAASIQRNRVESIVDQNKERLNLVSSRTQLRLSLKNYLQNPKHKYVNKMRRILNDAQTSIKSILSISILNNEGDVIVSTNEQEIGQNFASEEFFTRGKKESSADIFFINDNHQLNVHLSGPLYLNKAFLGVININVGVENLLASLSDYSGLGKTGETILAKKVDGHDEFIYLTPLRFNPQAALRIRAPINYLSSPIVPALLAKKSSTITTAIDYRNHAVLAATQYIESTGWGLMVKIDQSEAYSPLRKIKNILLLISLIIAFIVAFISFLLARAIAKPILTLTMASKGISQGILTQEVKLKSNDEIGVLANAFNQMTQKLLHTSKTLAQRNKELKLEVVERKKKEKELRETNEEIESFAYIASHDLRSPLVSIQGFAGELQRNIDDINLALKPHISNFDTSTQEKIILAIETYIPEAMDFINTSTHKMEGLINAILTLSRLGRRQLIFEEIDMTQLVNTSLKAIGYLIDKERIQVSVSQLPVLITDKIAMEQIFGNLLSNAVKYLDPQRSGKIDVSVTETKQNTLFHVKDNGCGIAENDLPRIFQIFTRVANNDATGEGMGLAYVKTLVKRLGGHIECDSILGEGTTFSFTVPHRRMP